MTNRTLATVAGLYGAVLLALAPVKPLWLDEIIELDVTSGNALYKIARTPGGSPLGYAGQWALRPLRGANPIWESRLPSVIAGVGALIAFLTLCRRLLKGTQPVLVAGVLWCICPLVLRYSLEGRPYMQGMLLSIVAVLAQMRLGERMSAVWWAALAIALAAAVYSQPFALFAPLVFSAYETARRRDLRYALATGAAYAAAVLSYAPWYWHVQHEWAGALLPNRAGFRLDGRLFATLLRECVGDGYAAAIPATIAAAYGALRGKWAAGVVVLGTVALALAADARFGYFFATRQIIYMLPFLLILMADGLAMLWRQRRFRVAALLLGVLFSAAALTKDYVHLADHSQDWVRLTSVVKGALDSGCLLTPTRDEAPLYGIIDPGLNSRICAANLADRVVIPITTYTDADTHRAVLDLVRANGLREASSTDASFATVKVFVR